MSQMRPLPEVDEMCFMGQVKTDEHEGVFSKLKLNANTSQTPGKPSDEDIETGYELFHALVYCPAHLFKMYTFVDHLLSNETSGTIIQTIVHLLQSSVITDRTTFTSAKRFYHVLASTLDLQYGNILLATSSNAKRETVLPFFLNQTDLVEERFQESNFDSVQDAYKDAWKLFMLLPRLLLHKTARGGDAGARGRPI